MYIYTKCFLCVVMMLAALWAQPAKAACETADVALVLADDVSASINIQEWELERQGYVHAFSDPEVIETILTGGYGCIWVMLVQWGGHSEFTQSLPWTLIDSEAAALAFARSVGTVERVYESSGTCISCGLLFAHQQFDSVPAEALRQVIDVSGDGTDDSGSTMLRQIREGITNEGVTINGLPILGGTAGLDSYFANNVIGGPSNFMIIADTPQDFGEAIRQKLILEIAGRVPPEFAVRYASR